MPVVLVLVHSEGAAAPQTDRDLRLTRVQITTAAVDGEREMSMDKHVSDYLILSDKYLYKLAQQVKGLLQENWQPYGPPYWSDTELHCQAMVRHAFDSVQIQGHPVKVEIDLS